MTSRLKSIQQWLGVDSGGESRKSGFKLPLPIIMFLPNNNDLSDIISSITHLIKDIKCGMKIIVLDCTDQCFHVAILIISVNAISELYHIVQGNTISILRILMINSNNIHLIWHLPRIVFPLINLLFVSHMYTLIMQPMRPQINTVIIVTIVLLI
eukprot:65854_1